MNFNSPPSGFMAQIAWCVEGLQQLWRRVNGLANNSGGGAGTYVPYTGANKPIALDDTATINDVTNNTASIASNSRVLIDENQFPVASWSIGSSTPDPTALPLLSIGDIGHNGHSTIVEVDDTNQTILLQGAIAKVTSLATGSVTQMVTTNNLGILNYQPIPTNGIVIISTDLQAQSGAIPSLVAYSVSGNHTYRVGCYVVITAILTDVLGIQVTWVDVNNNSHTRSFYPLGVSATVPNLAQVRDYEFSTMDIRAKDGTDIIIATTLITGGGNITYDVGASITLIS